MTAPPALLDVDLADALVAGRHGPPPGDLVAFERAFVALVEAGHADRDTAWDRFYDATLARIGAPGRAAVGHPALDGHARDSVAGTGTLACFRRIWRQAQALSRGPSVLDVGTCFGFLPLSWAARSGAPRLLAADLSLASAGLLARQARRLDRAVEVVCADGAALPLADRAVATVLLVHVLEHLPAPGSDAVLAEALRVAERRVVVAVPVEPAPDPVFGHLQTFDEPRLRELGRRTGWRTAVRAGDGAWLVLDRPGCAPALPHLPS